MNKKELINFIKQSLKKRNYNIELDESKLDMKIRDADIDSLLAFSIITDLENKFNTVISDEQLMSIETLNDLINIFLNQKTN